MAKERLATELFAARPRSANVSLLRSPSLPMHLSQHEPRSRLRQLVDRLVSPSSHRQAKLLEELTEVLSNSRDELGLTGRVREVLESILEVEHVQIFARRQERFRLLAPAAEAELIPSHFAFPRAAESWREPFSCQADNLSEDERSWLAEREAQWLVAACCQGSKRPLALLLIGRRVDGEHELKHRQAVATFAVRFADSLELLFARRRLRMQEAYGSGTWLKECTACGGCFDSDMFFCPQDDRPLEPTVLIDRQVAGRYLLEQHLGKGGMGAVYRAKDQLNDSVVAVKLLTGGDRVAHGRFANEAKAGQRLQHPHITRVLDSGTLKPQGAFMVMEFVSGDTLRQLLDTEGALHPKRVARIFGQIIAAVQYAHEQGVIHRDLKPDNLMIEHSGGEELAKVLDFGLAKLRAGSSGTHGALTAVGMVIGTLSYMSPEQLAAEKVDHQTDQFAVGAMIAEALTGSLPFQANTLGEMLQAVMTRPFRMQVTNAAQAQVAEIIGRALAKPPAERYPDIAGFGQLLLPALEVCPPFPRD